MFRLFETYEQYLACWVWVVHHLIMSIKDLLTRNVGGRIKLANLEDETRHNILFTDIAANIW